MLHRSLLFTACALGSFAMTTTAQTAPLPGQLVVSEIMFNPGPDVCVTDADGEYFEVTNISNVVLDLNDIYVEDRNTTTGLPSTFGFHTPPVSLGGTIAPLYPGRAAVFVRHSTNNGPLPIAPAYVYAATVGTPPADKSLVGNTQMMINNSNVDGLFIATGNFASLGGTIVETVSYNASLTPLVSNSGVSAERVNLFAPWVVDALNNNSANVVQPLLTALYGVPNGVTCFVQQRGTPGSTNSLDNTSWIQPNHYSSFNDSLGQNTGTLIPKGPASIGNGTLRFQTGGGVANGGYSFGYSSATSELYLSPFFLPSNPGAILLDLNFAVYLDGPTFTFDGLGNQTLNLALPNDPNLINQTFSLQWLAFDINTFTILLSNGLTVTMNP